ncbi:hypothetical protein Pfl04_42340 [Planosporangium flavigriseum]|uniref:Uncharacterized protein n=1 Tax=Planosporangium flavigriseum TaxID=373681 RepID=A0A8J3LS68_9ACTN|nr:hypothetical protein Pfl04_42340 [Planosporangium flavigriseum]
MIASALAWIVGALAAVGVGVLALSLIGDGLTSRTVQPLTPEVVAREAASAQRSPAAASAMPESGPATAPESAPATTPPAVKAVAPVGTEKLVSSPGGSAVARCAGGQVYLVSWSPAQGFRVDHVARGPGSQASVKFESDDDVKVFLTVRCVGGEPQTDISQRSDDRGGKG